MIILWKKKGKLENLIFEHVDLVEQTFQSFRKAIYIYLDAEDIEEAEEFAYRVHNLEGEADNARRKIETEILQGALLASSRGGMMEIIEGVDKLANAVEANLDFLLLQKIKIPEDLKPKIDEITDITLEIFEEVENALHKLFKNRNKALDHTKAIEINEGKVDELERDAIKILFSLELNLAEKLLVRDFIFGLCKISDRAEDLSDLLEMAVAQRIV